MQAKPWPEEWWGAEVGKACNIARAQRNLLQYEYPKRFRFLTNMNFMWLHPIFVEDDPVENQKWVREFAPIACCWW